LPPLRASTALPDFEEPAIELKRIRYASLNSRQKENFNFQEISAVLADYGFVSLRLSDDWQGADFIAQHIDGATFARVQLKGRLTFDAKYRGKDLWVAFSDGDKQLRELLEKYRISGDTKPIPE
jgi:hypothetical protein